MIIKRFVCNRYFERYEISNKLKSNLKHVLKYENKIGYEFFFKIRYEFNKIIEYLIIKNIFRE